MFGKDQSPIQPGQGKPTKFTPDQLQKKINEYFEWAKDNDKPYTLERLAVFLDCDKNTLSNYGKRGDSLNSIIKKALKVIEANKVEALVAGKGSTVGRIFDLKNNHGWVDKREVDQTGSLGIETTIRFVGGKEGKE